MLKAQGRATGGVAPFGFQFIDGRREWHQGEQETLAAIIEHRRAGLSWAKVADKLNATGHRTRTGGQWTRQGAHQVHQARELASTAPPLNRRQGRPAPWSGWRPTGSLRLDWHRSGPRGDRSRALPAMDGRFRAPLTTEQGERLQHFFRKLQ